MPFSLIAVVTGANKGIGLAIVRGLALQYPKTKTQSPLSNNNSDAPGPFLIYLTARDKTRGEQALQSLNDDTVLQHAKALAQQGGPTEIRYRQLDISEPGSIDALRDFLKREHPGGIDILVNNAGMAMQGFSKFLPPPRASLLPKHAC